MEAEDELLGEQETWARKKPSRITLKKVELEKRH